MEHVEANGASIPALGLGTWTLKGRHCADLVAHALSLGYRHLDTAAMYDNEEAVGEGLRASGLKRDDVFVTTKVWYTDIAPGDLERSARESLRRLGLDHVDLLLIHWPNPAIPVADSIGALNAVRAAGLTRHIGVSNFTTGLLAEAIAASEHPLVANQVEYHPRLSQAKVLAACRAAGMAMVSYCPLYRGGALFAEPAIAEAARRTGRTPAQIVLRWHVQQDGVVAIPRTTRKERLAENAAIFDFTLTEDEMAAISALSSAQSRICDFAFSPEWDAA
ncbi:aldo/keto reductase [Nitratireductor mangrovi]|uniref:Aldo/keto reductase n=1 Tax=Nitratireductor mangrovi TaxID=2599600 RepID=A0A5B8L6T6_9HYPH|nr:aldo/keto reductase [Nitratireductor mangrovi]QDZ03443.1 aldo/keto reductase [Nitratireductor mangrovi]